MTNENMSEPQGSVIITGKEQIRAFRLLTILRGMEAEIRHPGFKVCRVNVFNAARKEIGEHAPRKKVDVLRAFVLHLIQIGLLVPADPAPGA